MNADHRQSKIQNMARKSMDKKLTDEITPEDCGKKLDLICKAAGISLKKLAELLGEKPATLSHMKPKTNGENGRKATQKFMDKLRALALIRPKGYAHEETHTERLTVDDVAIGLSSLARTSLLGSPAVVAGALVGGIAGGLLSFGMLHAVAAISKQLGLSYRESEDELEITRESDE